jgi:hypothetical protein
MYICDAEECCWRGIIYTYIILYMYKYICILKEMQKSAIGEVYICIYIYICKYKYIYMFLCICLKEMQKSAIGEVLYVYIYKFIYVYI